MRTRTPKFHHKSPQLKTTQCIQYTILSFTYKSLQYKKPFSISDLLTLQQAGSTRFSAIVTLRWTPSNPSLLKLSDRSFYRQAYALLNNSTKRSLLSLFCFIFSTFSNQSFPSVTFSYTNYKKLKTHLSFIAFLYSFNVFTQSRLILWIFYLHGPTIPYFYSMFTAFTFIPFIHILVSIHCCTVCRNNWQKFRFLSTLWCTLLISSRDIHPTSFRSIFCFINLRLF